MTGPEAHAAYKQHRLDCKRCSDFDKVQRHGLCPLANKLWRQYVSLRLKEVGHLG